ncbi:hypothetical protein VV867_17275 [Pseudomonas sp. JH-2]|uniref:Imm43 family immunity protein n=1 Tax=unclassified Pseudomonas TaxID=196821 RepID=UPI0011B5541E|nr:MULTISPECIES: hypothetical protein [unclassified Pseudomonas]MED5609453.1 hypothetical protein [Pseudomonas sp. JH-2]
MNNPTYYFITYAANKGNSEHIPMEINHPEWEWNTYEPHPESITIQKDYKIKITDRHIKEFNADFYGTNTYFVSEKFIEACNELNVKYRKIPIEIKFSNGERPPKNYYVFLPAQNLSLLDTERSIFQEEKDIETGRPMINNLFPPTPVYSWIKKFSPLSTKLDLFRCTETMSLACSERFKNKLEQQQASNITFQPIDEKYRYDPWGEITD